MISLRNLAPLLLCLVQGRNDVSERRRYDDIRVLVQIPLSEVGPASCPRALQVVLKRLEAASAMARLQARRRLCKLNWRHLSWLRKEALRGGAERRLALLLVTKRLQDRRLAGQAPQPLELGLER